MGTTCPCKKIKRVTQRERDRQTDTTPIKPLQSRIPPLLLPFSFFPPSRQSNLLILNISAKSSPIFTKF